MAKHVNKQLRAQEDILSPQAIDAVKASIKELRDAIKSNADKETLEEKMVDLEKTAKKWIKPYPYAGWRENVEVLLVAIAVAMAIRTFFLQPFKIPTGSMQPTLFGITVSDLRNDVGFKMPNLAERLYKGAIFGTYYHEIIAPEDGVVKSILRPQSMGITRQQIIVQYNNQVSPTVLTLWFAPGPDFSQPAKVYPTSGTIFAKGTPILRFRETVGDYLFINRLTYNFTRPKRGDIVVFKTHGIDRLTKDYTGMPTGQDNLFYVKRLVGLPGETISIGEDRHIRINGQRLDASTPHFEKVYSFDPNKSPTDSQYSGHTQIFDNRWGTSIGDGKFTIRDRHFFVCGDNTASSLDSRFWGDLPQENVIGKYCFVYYPLSKRFGWGAR